MGLFIDFLKDCSPIIVAIITIIPTIISNRKKTQASVEEFKQEMKTAITDTQIEIREVKQNLAEHIRENEFNTAEAWRGEILRFDDGLCNSSTPYPSEANFQQILNFCDKYETFTDEHKDDFKNGIGEMAIAHIREVWRDVKHANAFGQFK